MSARSSSAARDSRAASGSGTGDSLGPNGYWIHEVGNKGGFRMMVIQCILWPAIGLSATFYLGIQDGLRFWEQGLTFRTHGWWEVSFAVYVILGVSLYALGLTAVYWWNGQIVRVGVSDSGVWFCTRHSRRLAPWDRFLPGPLKMRSGKGYVVEVLKPGSSWRTCTYALGPRAGHAIASNPCFPPKR